MNYSQSCITVSNRIGNDSYCNKIIYSAQIVSPLKFLIYAVMIFQPSRNICFDILLAQICFYMVYDMLKIKLALSDFSLNGHNESGINIRIQNFKRKFFKLGFYRIDSQSVGQRSIYVNGLQGLASRASRFYISPGSCIVNPVGKFNHKNAHIAAHRNNHFANRFRLRQISVFEFRKFCDSVDQTRNRISEFFATLVKRVISVFYSIVQKTCGNNFRPHAQICKNLRNCKRMNNIRLSGFSSLTGMLSDRAFVCSVQNRQVFVGIVRLAYLPNRKKRVGRVFADLAT